MPLGTGTERVETKCKELFPDAKVMRIDSDTINNITKLRDFIKKTQSNEIDILVGTQMLTKGHDFPELNLVGIIDIDAGLYSLDFRGLEKIGQMIIQVAGRSGRHNSQGKLIIQTRKPDNILMNELLNNGYVLGDRILQLQSPALYGADVEELQEYLSRLFNSSFQRFSLVISLKIISTADGLHPVILTKDSVISSARAFFLFSPLPGNHKTST